VCYSKINYNGSHHYNELFSTNQLFRSSEFSDCATPRYAGVSGCGQNLHTPLPSAPLGLITLSECLHHIGRQRSLLSTNAPPTEVQAELGITKKYPEHNLFISQEK